jgi:hypothetical protein
MTDHSVEVSMHPTQSRNIPFNFPASTTTDSTPANPIINRPNLLSTRASSLSSSSIRSERQSGRNERPAIVRITAAEYAVLYHNYINQALPESSLFPYLHGGADIVNTPAASYFGFKKGDAAVVPE